MKVTTIGREVYLLAYRGLYCRQYCSFVQKRDMSKYRLSQLTGISQSSIGKIIAKESLPTMPTVEKICDALGVTMAQFFAGKDVPVNLSESQQEVLKIWDGLDEKEQAVVMAMLRGLQK